MENENKIETMLSEAFNLISKNNDAGSAKAFGIDGTAFTTVKEIGRSSDVYDLIDEINEDKKQSNYEAVAVITTGWAAPLNKDGEIEGKPSEHNERRRITLMSMIMIKDGALASALKFDDEEEVIFDFGNATGALSEAMLTLAE